jgi:hypothetical protein
MKFVVGSLALFVVAFSTPAFADITANYVGATSADTMKIEIASNGDVRGDISNQNSYFITRDGHGYVVEASANGPVVMRVEDIVAVMAEQTKKLPEMPADVDKIMPAFALVKGEQVTIRGRQGIAYYMGSRSSTDRPTLVISGDPALAPLQIALDRQYDMSIEMMGHLLGTANPFSSMEDVLKTGAPLVFIGMELDTINDDPIPAARFALPAAPVSLDEVRKSLGVAA